MKNLIADFVDILYPGICPGCGNVYARGEETLCNNCELDLPLFRNEQIIENILGGRVALKSAAIFLKFYAGGLTQKLLHQVKYKNNRKLGEYLGEEMMLSNNNKTRFADIDIIIPIPLHEEKFKTRGYNQSELIANGIANVLNRPVDVNSVRRIEKSETQTRKSREQRWENVSGIFVCDVSLKNKNILLVDDVITTGATMEACANVVQEAGAKSMSFAVLATAMQ